MCYCHFVEGHLSYHLSDYTLQIFSETDLQNTGRLQIQFNEMWGRICSDQWTDLDALVACKTLGYTNGEVRVDKNYV